MPSGMGRGGVAKKASDIFSKMSEVERALWHTKLREHQATYRKYKCFSDLFMHSEHGNANVNKTEKAMRELLPKIT